MSINNIKLLTILAFASIYLVWGSTFLAISYGLKGFPPFMLSGFRFLIAGLILVGWRHIRAERNYSGKNWKRNAITGTLILTGGTGLVAWGEQYISSTEAAIAIATGPFWFIALDRNNWKRYFSSISTVAGLITGFAGLLVFFLGSTDNTPSGGEHKLKVVAFLVLALSSISWVLGSLYSRNHPATHSTLMNTGQQLLIAGLAAFLIAGLRGEWQAFAYTRIPVSAWLGLVFLIFFGSIVAYLSYIWLLSVKLPVVVSTHTYINPIVAVLVGWLVAGEHITGGQAAGLGVILAGVLLTNLSHYKITKRTKVRLRRLVKALRGNVSDHKYVIDF
jgi:drug/metabolite transporter (DMT)-like permease